MTIMPKGKKWQSSIAGLDCCSAQPECANRFVQVDAKGPKSRAPAIVIDVAHSCRVRQRYLAGGAHGFQCGLHEVRSFITRNGVGSVQFFSPLSHRIYALHSPHSAVSFLMLQFRLLSIEIVTTSWFGVGGLVRGKWEVTNTVIAQMLDSTVLCAEVGPHNRPISVPLLWADTFRSLLFLGFGREFELQQGKLSIPLDGRTSH